MGLQKIKEKIKNIYSNDISILEDSYIDTKHRASFICNKHGKEFNAFTTNILQGKCAGCEICKEESKRKIDLSKVIPKIQNKPIKITGHHMNKSHVYIDFKCEVCKNHFTQKKDPIVYKDNNIDCPYCGVKPHSKYSNGYWVLVPKTTAQYKKEVYELVGDEYSVIGQYIGALTPLEMKHNVCNNTWKIKPNNFLSGGKRCPYCILPKGEKEIKTFLQANNIKYETQKRFNNLIGIGNRLLSYDFYLPTENILIEFQGEQHKRPIDYFGGEDYFKIQQEHDKRKREYAKQNNIKLLEIWYYDFDNIENILKSHLVA